MGRDIGGTYHDGRDEMNLADFPISALPRQQRTDGAGHKLDRMQFESSRYDPTSRRRIAQKVTLTTSSQDGLPTPADEHVILGLLHVAKHTTNFAEPTVSFAPSQLFDIMGWSPNGRSYKRLRDVLRRLKSLTIRYENSWWDAAGRNYEEEVATGIIAAYRIARQVSGPKCPRSVPVSWVTWTPQFHESLKNGNLKKLNLDVFFGLSSPTAQRMYRFLDKRFYKTSTVTMDLIEFACGHIGLAESDNVAVLKRRLAPAIAELEAIGFLAPMDAEKRYQKVKVGIWRIHFEAKAGEADRRTEPVPFERRTEQVPVSTRTEQVPFYETEHTLAREFYRLWDETGTLQPGARDLEQVRSLLASGPEEQAGEVLKLLVQVTRREWPECRSLSGAIQKYLPDARKLYDQRQRLQRQKEQAEEQRRRQEQTRTEEQNEEQRRTEAWARLSPEQRQVIRTEVLAKLGGGAAPEAFVHRLCLQAVGKMTG